MVKRCIAGGCSNTATTDVSLHYFPVNKEMRDAWTTAVKLTRDRWNGPTKHSLLCSDHFSTDCFKQETSEFARGVMTEMGLVYRRRRALKADAIPTLFTASNVKVSPKKSLSQAIAKRNQAQQVPMRNSNAALECKDLTICDIPTFDKERTPNMSIPVNPTPSDASDCCMSQNNILQNMENPGLMKEKADLQMTELLQLFSSQCPMCQSKVMMEKVVCGVVFILNLKCPLCGYRQEWKNLDCTDIPAANESHQTEHTEETTLEIVSDSVPEFVYFVGEDSDRTELSDISSESGDLDSGEDWDPKNELYFDEADGDEELCTDCGNFFKTRKPHTCEHKTKPLSCNTCGRRFTNRSSLSNHEKIHDADHEVVCKYCHIKIKTKAAKTAHEQNHLTEEKPYKCLYCSETFVTFKKRKIHLKIHRRPEEMTCPTCGLEFSEYARLRRHLVVHTGEKPFKCSVCERSFNLVGNLKCHMRLHTEEKAFKCQHCDQGFNRNVSLKNHIQRYHTPGSEYQQKKTKKKKRNGSDSQGRPERSTTDSLFQAKETQEQGSDINAAKTHKTRRTRRAQTSALGSLTQ